MRLYDPALASWPAEVDHANAQKDAGSTASASDVGGVWVDVMSKTPCHMQAWLDAGGSAQASDAASNKDDEKGLCSPGIHAHEKTEAWQKVNCRGRTRAVLAWAGSAHLSGLAPLPSM